MMSYLYVSKKKQPRSPGGWYAAVGICIFVIIGLIFWRFSIFSVFTSWWRGETAFLHSAAVSTHWFADKAALALRIDELQNENNDLHAKTARLEAKANAYDALVSELNATSTMSEGVLAKIIRRPPFTIFDTYVIDKGSNEAVAVGDSAYAHGIQVGIVKSVTATNALVHLYSSPGERLLVNFGTTSVQYEAYGIGNGVLKADIPRDAHVAEGGQVTRGDRDITFVGLISAIDRETNATSKSIFISLPFDIESSAWLIIKKP